MKRAPLIVPVLAGALLLNGCLSFARSRTAPSPTPPPEDVTYGDPSLGEFGEPSPAELTAGESPAASTTGTITITLLDQNDRNPEAIPVQMKPPGETKLSDANGQVAFEAAGGEYVFQVVPGCSDRVIVEYAGSGRAAVVAGSSVGGQLRAVWKHRIAPSYVAYPSTGPTWFLGEVVKITYDLLERCENERAPNADFPTWAFNTDGLEIVGTPAMRSGADARASVDVRCTKEGEPKLLIYDTRNPDDSGAMQYIPFGTRPECRKRES
ncbi:MAG: hypothetical protein ACRDI1_04695 [Actinomycetota bacterium]